VKVKYFLNNAHGLFKWSIIKDSHNANHNKHQADDYKQVFNIHVTDQNLISPNGHCKGCRTLARIKCYFVTAQVAGSSFRVHG
jgi:hypothetical protein